MRIIDRLGEFESQLFYIKESLSVTHSKNGKRVAICDSDSLDLYNPILHFENKEPTKGAERGSDIILEDI